MRLEDIREIATRLPEVEEKPHFGHPAFRVRDRLFVSVHGDDAHAFAIVHVDHSVAAAAAADAPEMLEEIWRTHGDKRILVGLKVEPLSR